MRIGIPRIIRLGNVLGVRERIHRGNEVLFCANWAGQFMDIQMPHTYYAIATYYIIARQRPARNARYYGVRYACS